MKLQNIGLSLATTLIVTACGVQQSGSISEAKQSQALQESMVLADVQRASVKKFNQNRIIAKSVSPSKMLAQPHFLAMPAVEMEVNRDKFERLNFNGIKQVSTDPVSTFSVDVDTGAYAVVRQYLNRGQLPPSDAIRIEELINYFDYQYPQPSSDGAPFSVQTSLQKTPWSENTHLVKIGLQGYQAEQQRKAANLVFLIDVSGSMGAANKLPLLKNAFKLLTKQLDEHDSVSMVVYAGSSGVVLEPTKGNDKVKILSALDNLNSGGSTHGSAGIKLAYQLAQQSFIKDGINRVILATDGDFNVGTVSQNALLDLIEQNKKKSISLTTLGFGHGNYNDALMEQLADHGDGNYAYIDQLSEARKVLVEQIAGTLNTIAKDVKIQVEWNPEQVAEYRLIGYENRALKREDFNNDKVDAGEIGAGHTVTALYEVTLSREDYRSVDALRYQPKREKTQVIKNNEIGFVKLRYKKPHGSKDSILLSQVIAPKVTESIDTRFAAAVAAFGEKLRGGNNLSDFTYNDIVDLVKTSRGDDEHGYRAEFLRLVKLTQSIAS